MYSQIVNPINGNKVSVNSKLGKKIIYNYIKILQKGGAVLFPESGTVYGVMMTHLEISPNIPAQIKHILNQVSPAKIASLDASYPLNTFDYLSKYRVKDIPEFVNDWFFSVPDNITVFFATPVGKCALASDTEEKILTALSMDIDLGRDSDEPVSKSLSKFLYQYANDLDVGYNLLEHHSDLDHYINNMGEYSGGDIIMNLKVDLDVPSDKWNIFLKETDSLETHKIFNDKEGKYQGYYNLSLDITKRRRQPRKTSSPIWEKLSANHSYLLSDILNYISTRWHDKHIELWVQGCNIISHTETWMAELSLYEPTGDIATYITNISEQITQRWRDIMLIANRKFKEKANSAPMITRFAVQTQRKELNFYPEEEEAFVFKPLSQSLERTRRRHIRDLRARDKQEQDSINIDDMEI